VLSVALPPAQFFAGLDWAAEVHAVCVMDTTGNTVDRFAITHSAEGIAMLLRRLAKLGDPADVQIGIERPNGRLVDLLLEAGHPVVPVSPNAIKAWREGEVLSGAKSDAADAAVIAEYLRLRQHRLRVATPYSDDTRALRTVVRTRTDLVHMRVAATNQPAALPDDHWPGAKAVFADVESPISLEFLTRYPIPNAARHLGEKRMAAFMVKHGYSGRRPAAMLLERLRSAPAGSGRSDRRDPHRGAARCRARPGGGIEGVERRGQEPGPVGRRHLGEHPDGEIFTSLPRSGQINAAQMLAEWGDCRQACDGPDSVAALAGCTPVTKQSGKHRAVHFRWACNKRFRVAMTTFADNSRHSSPWAAKIYNHARRAGKNHPHAVQVLARAWIRVIWRCWLDGVPYNPAAHGAAAALNELDAA
jgi:transposase